MDAGYIGESFWDSNTITTILLLLFVFIVMCIPAVVSYRYNDRKQMLISVLCGFFGMFLLIPWIVSVVQVSKKYNLPEKSKGFLKPWIYIGISLALIILGSFQFVRFYAMFKLVYGISLVIHGAGLLIVTLLSGKKYWGGLMIMAPLLITCVNFEFTDVAFSAYKVLAIAGVGLIICDILMSCVRQTTAQTADSDIEQLWQTGKKDADDLEPEVSTNDKTEFFTQSIHSDGQQEITRGGNAMRFERCIKGHFYDSSKYGKYCPYCTETKQTDALQGKNVIHPINTVSNEKAASEMQHTSGEKTAAVNEPMSAVREQNVQRQSNVTFEQQPVKSSIEQKESPCDTSEHTKINKKSEPVIKTAAPGVQQGKHPVVGWIVCIKGVYRGESFTLKNGRNFIGRSADMDISLSKDDSIADVKQATIIYEPRSREFILLPGDVNELCYINNKVVLAGRSMSAYDVLDIGNTSLLLIPCCGERFNWENGLTQAGK